MKENRNVNIRNYRILLELNCATISLDLTLLKVKQTLQKFLQLIFLVLLMNDRCNQNKGNNRRAPLQHL